MTHLRLSDLLTLACAASLCACGSGGGGAAPAPPAATAAAATSASGSATTSGSAAGNQAPVIQAPGHPQIDEEQELVLKLSASDPEGDPLRLFLTQRPPGASWDEARRELRWRPDFIQGGRDHPVELVASDGRLESKTRFLISVRDTIQPPAPRVIAREAGNGFTRLVLEQRTDAFLAGASRAGRTYRAIVCVPALSSAQAPKPVRVALHGFGGSPWREGWSGEFRIAPHDPDNTYWWGYQEGGRAENFTQRRVLHLLGWVLANHPGADPERVYVEGASMGGAGAATLGLLSARHFCWVSATYGQWIPQNHRPSRIRQLSGHWGSPQQNLPSQGGLGVWERMDLTRVLAEHPEARQAFVFLHHAKDDGIIHFGAVVQPSPLTARSLYQTLQAERIGHFALWDEGGHVSRDPHLPAQWWGSGWNPVFDPTSSLRRSQSFPAFSRSGLDEDPGDGQGNGRRAFDPESGYAASVSQLADTGWNGARAGSLNRFLRWDATRLVDTTTRYALPLRAQAGPGGAPPRAGDPTTGDQLPAGRTPRVDVTLRRVQAFACLPHEEIQWSCAGQQGKARANAKGELTIPGLVLSTSWQTLELRR